MASVPRFAITLALACVSLGATADDLRSAHDRQDRAALDRAVREAAGAAAKQPQDAGAHFRLAQAESFLAEVDLELRDKAGARAAAEAGIRAAERAVALQPAVAEHHRIFGTLCGQVIPAQVVLAFKYGRCARASIERALELDPKSSIAHLSRGVGNYYLPPAFGGGIELAIRDFRKAVELDPRSADAHLWLGIALRKARRNAEARKEILKSIELNPNRIWARQQLDKTPAQ
jgi:tetratricopeptide (TPR) repeat protein